MLTVNKLSSYSSSKTSLKKKIFQVLVKVCLLLSECQVMYEIQNTINGMVEDNWVTFYTELNQGQTNASQWTLKFHPSISGWVKRSIWVIYCLFNCSSFIQTKSNASSLLPLTKTREQFRLIRAQAFIWLAITGTCEQLTIFQLFN